LGKTVGIDDMAAYLPKLYVDAEELAKERNIPPGKITKGLGIEKLAIPDAHEDAATMAAMATLELIEKNDLSPKDIDFIQVATETSPDASKPISCYVQGMLEQIYGRGSFDHVGAPETKFACVGATYALIDRLAYIASGWNKAEYSIVVATDIARYRLNSSGEPTQGAAAIALLLKEEPRLLAYEPEFTGFGTVDDRDFFRPVESKTAVVDGQYSIGCYLRDMRIAADAYKRNMVKFGALKSLQESVVEKIDLAAFHTPFPKMAQYAFASLLIHDWRSLPKWKKIIEKIGPEPSREGLSDVEFYISEEYKNFRRKFMKTEEFQSEYKSKIENSLIALRQIGNSYTASVWLGVESHFETRNDDLAGKRFGIGSYGFNQSIKRWLRRWILCASLMRDGGYQRLKLHESVIPPKNEFALISFGNKSYDYGYRYYKYIK